MALKLNSAEIGISADLVGIAQDFIIDGLPLYFSVKHFLNVHVSGQGLFRDLEVALSTRSYIGTFPESFSNLLHVDSVALRFVLRGKVMEVLESNLDLVLSEWSGVELGGISNTGTYDLT